MTTAFILAARGERKVGGEGNSEWAWVGTAQESVGPDQDFIPGTWGVDEARGWQELGGLGGACLDWATARPGILARNAVTFLPKDDPVEEYLLLLHYLTYKVLTPLTCVWINSSCNINDVFLCFDF